MARPTGLRSLALIRASGSTARVLNLAVVGERFADTEEYVAHPLLRSPRLNKALILKHIVRASERDLFDAPMTTTTKVVLPFAASELHLGGHALLFGERNFERALTEMCGGSEDAAKHDLDVLTLLNSLPSFDPFLMRERLRQSGYEPARCYFEMSEADIHRMQKFVGEEIGQLVGLAFANGGGVARDLSQKLAEKLMTDETAKALDPLRSALQLSEDAYREGVFSWKGFLYYKWLAASLLPRLEGLSRELLSVRVNRAEDEARAQLAQIRRTIVSALGTAATNVENALLDYGMAFAALSEGNPLAFRDFLLRAPEMFIPMGEAIGIIQHIESFWAFRFPGNGAKILPADEAFEIFSEFEATLGGAAFAQAPRNSPMLLA